MGRLLTWLFALACCADAWPALTPPSAPYDTPWPGTALVWSTLPAGGCSAHRENGYSGWVRRVAVQWTGHSTVRTLYRRRRYSALDSVDFIGERWGETYLLLPQIGVAPREHADTVLAE
jgi:hypothetical protein